MRRGAGIGVGEASEPGDIAGQFDDPLVVDVVQHKIQISASGAIALRSPLATAAHRPIYGWKWRKYSPVVSSAVRNRTNSAAVVSLMWDSGVRRQTAPS